MEQYPRITTIIPSLNEEDYIGKCLDSIMNNDYPSEKLEVFVVDGMSEDRTKEIVKKYSENHSNIILLENPDKVVPFALNKGIRSANGEVIIRLDAHTTYKKDYFSKCIRYLREFGADNVGGICVTLPGNDSTIAKCNALVLSHRFGVGNSYFRIGLKEPRDVDTVPFGCYRKDVFDKIGLFNEHLVRNQDIEFNLRLKNAGGKILLVPDIESYYHARSTLKGLIKNNFWNGFWVIYSTKFAKITFSKRHLIPMAFVLSLLGSLIVSALSFSFIYIFSFILACYLLANIFFSAKISLINGLKLMPLLMLTFFALHTSYGLGSIWGFIKLFVSR